MSSPRTCRGGDLLTKLGKEAPDNFKTGAQSPEFDSQTSDAFGLACFILTAKPTANRINSGTCQYMMANWRCTKTLKYSTCVDIRRC
jgi:hypothetical protein